MKNQERESTGSNQKEEPNEVASELKKKIFARVVKNPN